MSSEQCEGIKSDNKVEESNPVEYPPRTESPRTSESRSARTRDGENRRSRSRERSNSMTRSSRGTRRSRSSSRGRDPALKTRNFMDPTDPLFEHTVDRFERSPGPVYNTGESVDKILPHAPAARIGTEKRTTNKTTISPGPGEFSPDETKASYHPQSPRATIGRAPKQSSLIRDTSVSGPPIGPVAPEVTSPRAFRATIGKARRDTPPKEHTPGPADYEKPREQHVSSKKGTFSGADRGAASWIFYS
ncbi:uncharacterized protein MONOS_17837 [Monocercomonoides exilis]|uniref:uncharacterized protein n=1 Tax=Monocercomonoides exilis TaxID=2049356 RepID=UPI00355A76B5|nr:hypothetical protein MONOS_17836 [Monocercomonoides exilis]KAH7820587.1 hypothetical protein MONOS_17837 [Monocercomonoides exilis]